MPEYAQNNEEEGSDGQGWKSVFCLDPLPQVFVPANKMFQSKRSRRYNSMESFKIASKVHFLQAVVSHKLSAGEWTK